jgi:protein-disulfide isomerase
VELDLETLEEFSDKTRGDPPPVAGISAWVLDFTGVIYVDYQSRVTRLQVPVDEARDHILGPPSAPATLVEYGDFECPYCGQAHPIVKQLQAQLGPQLRFVYRHFPLIQVHPHAELAAEASEAAGAQGKFWEMHDLLFENQEALDVDDLIGYAVELDLDLPRFHREFAGHVYAPRVLEDLIGGARSGVHGTPTFFINGVRHEGPFDFDTLFNAIEAAISTTAGRS